MNSPAFLLDEHLPHALIRALQQREPTLRVYAVGRPEGPPRTAKDPQLLLWIEDHECLMVTNDRASLTAHLQEHLAAGHHIPGILVVPRFFSFRTLIDELHLIWGASLPDEYRDQIVYLPIRR